MSVGTLEYRGNAGLNDMSAFNVRVVQTWRGDNLFRCYVVDDSLYFIRVGGSKQRNAAVGAQFGLVGALIIYFKKKRDAKKQQETLNTIAGADPRELIASHKYNFVLPTADVSGALLRPPAWLGGDAKARLTFTLATGKKRQCSFDDVDNAQLAIAQLGAALGSKLDVQASYDEKKKKFRKPSKA